MRRAGRVDSNHRLVVAAFRHWGASVHSCAQLGDGFPDLAVGFHGANHLVEIKGRTGKLTRDQVRFFETWMGWIDVVRSAEDADALVKQWREEGDTPWD
jgi:hypothetical protein